MQKPSTDLIPSPFQERYKEVLKSPEKEFLGKASKFRDDYRTLSPDEKIRAAPSKDLVTDTLQRLLTEMAAKNWENMKAVLQLIGDFTECPKAISILISRRVHATLRDCFLHLVMQRELEPLADVINALKDVAVTKQGKLELGKLIMKDVVNFLCEDAFGYTCTIRTLAFELLNLLVEKFTENQQYFHKHCQSLDPVRKFVAHLAAADDYLLQSLVVEVLFRLERNLPRGELAELFLSDELGEKFSQIKTPTFAEDVRAFVNAFNDQQGDTRRVYSFEAKLVYGNSELPTQWLDFGYSQLTFWLLDDANQLAAVEIPYEKSKYTVSYGASALHIKVDVVPDELAAFFTGKGQPPRELVCLVDDVRYLQQLMPMLKLRNSDAKQIQKASHASLANALVPETPPAMSQSQQSQPHSSQLAQAKPAMTPSRLSQTDPIVNTTSATPPQTRITVSSSSGSEKRDPAQAETPLGSQPAQREGQPSTHTSTASGTTERLASVGLGAPLSGWEHSGSLQKRRRSGRQRKNDPMRTDPLPPAPEEGDPSISSIGNESIGEGLRSRSQKRLKMTFEQMPPSPASLETLNTDDRSWYSLRTRPAPNSAPAVRTAPSEAVVKRNIDSAPPKTTTAVETAQLQQARRKQGRKPREGSPNTPVPAVAGTPPTVADILSAKPSLASASSGKSSVDHTIALSGPYIKLPPIPRLNTDAPHPPTPSLRDVAAPDASRFTDDGESIASGDKEDLEQSMPLSELENVETPNASVGTPLYPPPQHPGTLLDTAVEMMAILEQRISENEKRLTQIRADGAAATRKEQARMKKRHYEESLSVQEQYEKQMERALACEQEDTKLRAEISRLEKLCKQTADEAKRIANEAEKYRQKALAEENAKYENEKKQFREQQRLALRHAKSQMDSLYMDNKKLRLLVAACKRFERRDCADPSASSTGNRGSANTPATASKPKEADSYAASAASAQKIGDER